MLKRIANTGVNLVVLGVSVAIFLVAFFALSALGAAGRPPTIEVLSATRDLNTGDVISTNTGTKPMPIANGAGRNCLRKRNGKKRRAGRTVEPIRGGTIFNAAMGISMTKRVWMLMLCPAARIAMDTRTLRRLAITQAEKAPMGFTTWQAMCGSGWQIGTIRVTTPSRHPITLKDRLRENTALCGAARGTALVTTSVLRVGSGTILPIPSTASAFGARSRPDSGILCSEILIF